MLLFAFILTCVLCQEYTEDNPCEVTEEELLQLYKCKDAAHIKTTDEVTFWYSDKFPRFDDYWKNKETISGPLFCFFFFDMANLTFPELRKADTTFEVIYGQLLRLSLPKLETITNSLDIYNNPQLAEVELKDGLTIGSGFIENNNKLRNTVLDKMYDAIVSEDFYLQEDGNCIFPFTVTSLKELEGCKLIEAVTFDPYVTDLDFSLPKMTITREVRAIGTNLKTLSFFDAGQKIDLATSEFIDNSNLCDKDLKKFSNTVKKNCVPQVYTKENPCLVSQAGINSLVTCKEAAHIKAIHSVIQSTVDEKAFNEYWKNKQTVSGDDFEFRVNFTQLTFPELVQTDSKLTFAKSKVQKLNFPKLKSTQDISIRGNPNLTEINFKKGIKINKLQISYNNKMTEEALKKVKDATACESIEVQNVGDCTFPFPVASLKEFKGCKIIFEVSFTEQVIDLDIAVETMKLSSKIRTINTNLKTLSFLKTSDGFVGNSSEIRNNANLCDKDLDRFVTDKDYLVDNCLTTQSPHVLITNNTNNTSGPEAASDSPQTTFPPSPAVTTTRASCPSFVIQALLLILVIVTF